MAAAASDPFSVSEIAPGVFVHSGMPLALNAPGHDDIANIGFVVGTRCVAVIDTGGSVRVGRALHAAIRRSTPLPVCYVINTHVHVDHVLGNVAFKDDPAVFVGHAELAAALERSRDFFLKNYAGDFDAPPQAGQIIAPSRRIPVGSDADLDLGGRHLRLHAWPEAHTDCDLTVLDEQTHTLFSGDLVFLDHIPVIDGSLKGWLDVLPRLAALPAERVLPGHGRRVASWPGALDDERRYLLAVEADARALIASGTPLAQAVPRIGQSEKGHWRLFDDYNPRNATAAFSELEWE